MVSVSTPVTASTPHTQQFPVVIAVDMFTSPPTSITIPHPNDTNMQASMESTIALRLEDFQPTEGKALLEKQLMLSSDEKGKTSAKQHQICLLYADGRCSGRTNSDETTCSHLHAKQSTLDALRSRYTLPLKDSIQHRTSIRAQISPQLFSRANMLMLGLCGRKMIIKFLEFDFNDVKDTSGLQAFLADRNANHGRAKMLLLCDDYCLRSSHNGCLLAHNCGKIHADLSQSLARDRIVVRSFQLITQYPMLPMQTLEQWAQVVLQFAHHSAIHEQQMQQQLHHVNLSPSMIPNFRQMTPPPISMPQVVDKKTPERKMVAKALQIDPIRTPISNIKTDQSNFLESNSSFVALLNDLGCSSKRSPLICKDPFTDFRNCIQRRA